MVLTQDGSEQGPLERRLKAGRVGPQPDPRQLLHGSFSGSGLMTFGGCQRLFGDAESISGPALSHTALSPE